MKLVKPLLFRAKSNACKGKSPANAVPHVPGTQGAGAAGRQESIPSAKAAASLHPAVIQGLWCLLLGQVEGLCSEPYPQYFISRTQQSLEFLLTLLT